MKKSIALLIAAGFIAFGYHELQKSKSPPKQEIVSVSPDESASEPKKIEILPVERVAESTPAPKKEEREKLPKGYFVLLAKKSVETDAGIFGYPPGTVLQEKNGEFVTQDGRILEVNSNEITNDAETAKAYIRADKISQFNLKKAVATPAPEVVAAPSTPEPVRQSAPISSGALGQAHTRIKDGWLWQKDRNGEWERVRPTK